MLYTVNLYCIILNKNEEFLKVHCIVPLHLDFSGSDYTLLVPCVQDPFHAMMTSSAVSSRSSKYALHLGAYVRTGRMYCHCTARRLTQHLNVHSILTELSLYVSEYILITVPYIIVILCSIFVD